MKDEILKEFYELQCNEDSGDFNDDETPLVGYSYLERELKLSRERIRPDIIELRNDGFIELTPAVNQDYIPSGSGWMLTEKGQKLVKEKFYITPKIQ